MNILVTGGAGYLGSTLVPALLAAGHAVRVVDTLRYGQHAALAACARYPGFEFRLGDARELTSDDLDWCGVFVPLAALVGAPICDRYRDESYYLNYKAVERALDYLPEDRLVIYPNTNSGYGVAGDEPVTEDAPLAPVSWYGGWKCAAERSVMSRRNSVTLRLATVYGMSPRMRLDLLVNDFVRRALVDRSIVLFEAHHRRSVVHVRDVAQAFLHVVRAWGAGRNSVYWSTLDRAGRVFNVAETNVTKRQLAEMIAARTPLTILEAEHAADPDKRDYAVSSDRLLSTGFEFKHGLTGGIAELLRGLPMLPQTPYGNV